MLKYINMSQLWDIANEKRAGCFSLVEWKIADQLPSSGVNVYLVDGIIYMWPMNKIHYLKDFFFRYNILILIVGGGIKYFYF